MYISQCKLNKRWTEELVFIDYVASWSIELPMKNYLVKKGSAYLKL